MKTPALILTGFAIGLLLSHCKSKAKSEIPPEPRALTFEEKFSGSWRQIRVASGVDDGCTGLSLWQEFTILRKDSRIEISGKLKLRDGTVIEKAPRTLTASEYEELISDLLFHHQIATIEKNIKEYFAAMPEAEREEKLVLYFKTNPEPYGGFGGNYLYLLFDTDKADSAITNGFEDPRSYAACSDWIRNAP